MENRSHALFAGIFVLVLGVAMAVALWWLSQSDAQSERYVIVARKNVTGLNVQAPVRYRGIRAGKVESIAQDPADPRLILVTILLDERFKVSRGSTAQLGYQGVTGLAYVQIEDDGSLPEPLLGRDGQLPRIALRDTLFDSLSDRAGDLLGKLSGMLERINRVLDEPNLKHVERTLENVAAVSDGLRELVSPANVQRWQRIVAHVETTAGAAAPLAAEVRTLVTTMTAVAQRADALLQGAEATTARLNVNTLPQAEQMLRELNQSARHLSALLEGLERQPQTLITGRAAPMAGPGETGFVAPTVSAGEK